ncbi:hypothetical protein QBC34DRAFT_87152 [Podospora aff. communis PSN243]|uniref:Uncharacterized protein n=1 Tax=Podospora aff. communis PSN243 TaxID=3040156 RepID=A0AAV9GN46_9PEZI|nr:hypothetical protein QBC34DRAFT_87152 [Podospora aff. communis PSN243]
MPTATMEPMRPTKNIKDEFNIALMVITTIFGTALYIFGGITAYKLHSLGSNLPVYQGAQQAAAVRNAKGGRPGRRCIRRRSCTAQLALVQVMFLLLWPFFMMYALGWWEVYCFWRLLRARGKGAETEGRVVRGLREGLECESTMPIPRLCRRAMGMKKGGNREDYLWSDVTGLPAGGKGEDVELGPTSMGAQKALLPSFGGDSTMFADDKAGKKEVVSETKGGREQCQPRLLIREQDIADGLQDMSDTDQKEDKEGPKPLPIFLLQPPRLPDRSSSLGATMAELWTIQEIDEDAVGTGDGPDRVDVEIETMATNSVKPTKRNWSPI